ncbi:flocculation protein FLO11 [Hyalella azteca]|uniref:Flocculation protein FLO11 n=1 Tax=Hyalella azteca TaxID=294128 RepID=A0A8B7P3Y5_HYAAZ|nr:flocculation protein FLO11 [Hyalella azteca]
MLLVTLVSLFSMTSAQTFSLGIGLGASDVIPAFDSQRSASASTSSQNPNPFTATFSNQPSTRIRGSSPANFEDFFSSSRVATPQSSSARSRSSTSASPSGSVSARPAPLREAPAPNPIITSRGAPIAPSVTPARTVPAREPGRPQASQIEIPSDARETSRAATPRPQATVPIRNRGSPPQGDETVKASFDVSSRGREQDLVPRDPITRPPSTTTETNEVFDVRDNLVGQSICARGVNGDACRKHLATTAMSCTSGFCHECQQCGNMSPDLWPKCCREHYLCCRPLARACQACDQPALQPFCGAAFGRCN